MIPMHEPEATTSVSPPREKIDIAVEFVEELVPIREAFPGRRIYRSPRFPASASFEDLRSLDVEKEEEAVEEVSSPRGVLEVGLRYSGSETNSSKASISNSRTRIVRNNSSLWRGLVRLWRKKSIKRFSSFPPGRLSKASRSRNTTQVQAPGMVDMSKSKFGFLKPSWKCFAASELRNATNNFSPENIIGKGGYAEVYKGCLEDGQLVAVKKLTRGTADERTITFLTELGIIVHIDHPNVAKLVGVGVEGGMYLVFELSHNGSLANLLHDSDGKLDWNIRYRIAIGTAVGLEYLHEWCQRRIIHRDIKAANILLTKDFEPQICDFGLAKWLPDKLTHQTVSTFEGTFGYLAPEYFMHGIIDEKTDVYAFGVVLLELITGRKALDSSQQSLVMWATPLLENNDLEELVDPSLGDSYNCEQLKQVAQIASLCIQHSSIMRPHMSQVLKLLKSEEGRSDGTKENLKPLRRRTYSEEIFDAEEYNATRYLNDLTRHKQLALDF